VPLAKRETTRIIPESNVGVVRRSGLVGDDGVVRRSGLVGDDGVARGLGLVDN
jgi:hypothetical protein